MICPCKGCNKRWVSEDGRRCHTTCPEYNEWKEYMQAVQQNLKRRKITDDMIGSVLFGRRRTK